MEFPAPISSNYRGKNRVECKFFQQGRCRQGAQCQFLHLQDLRGLAISPLFPSPAISSFKPFCKFFRSGGCTNPSCQFKHDTAHSTSFPVHHPETSSYTTQQPPIQAVCKFWGTPEGCARGNACYFQHSLSLNPLAKPQNGRGSYSGNSVHKSATRSVSKQGTVSNGIREEMLHDSIKVRFGKGLAVETITTSFESCQVAVSGISKSANVEMLRTALRPPLPTKTTLSKPTSLASHHVTALLTYATPAQALEGMMSVRGSTIDGQPLSARLEFHANESGLPTLRSTNVKLSWFRAVKTATLGFDLESDAREDLNRFSEKIIRARKISAKLQLRLGGKVFLTLRNLDPKTTEQEIRNFTTSSITSISFRDPTYEREQQVHHKIQNLCSDFGVVEDFERFPSGVGDPKNRALVRFASPDAASAAVSLLNNHPQPFLGNSNLWLARVFSVRYSLPRRRFNVLRSSIDECQKDFLRIRLPVRIKVWERDESNTPLELVCIRLYGEDAKDLAKAKTRVESLICGKKVMEKGQTFWDEFFTSEAVHPFLTELKTSHSVDVRVDISRRVVFLFGDEIATDAAEKRILARVEQARQNRGHIKLSKSHLGFVVRGGLHRISALPGVTSSRLNIVTKTLVVEGDIRAISATRDLLSSVQGAGGGKIIPVSTSMIKMECPICACLPDDPIKLECGHHYCKSCLTTQLLNATETNAFPIICFATTNDGKSCKKRLSLDIFASLLSPDEELRLREGALTYYIRANSKEFRYCPTPDCNQIYRVSEEDERKTPTILQCPACYERICAVCCSSFHDGVSCSDYQFSFTEQAVHEQWKKDHGVQPCPGCGLEIEKAEGCNHVMCTGCQTHMCWVCLQTFQDGEGIYEHMRQEHGRIG